MSDEEFGSILALGYERVGIEFKGPSERGNRPSFAKVVRAVLGMANRRDGGLVIIGVADTNGVLSSVGLTDIELRTWRYDDVSAGIAPYADPFVSFELEEKAFEGKRYVVLHVREFEEIPVLCRSDYQGVLRAGGCYVRSRRKPETSEMPSQTEMRELLDLAVAKGLRRFVQSATSSGFLLAVPPQQPGDGERYEAELGDLLK
jgi:predicted HTH transcriptional regulator